MFKLKHEIERRRKKNYDEKLKGFLPDQCDLKSKNKINLCEVIQRLLVFFFSSSSLLHSNFLSFFLFLSFFFNVLEGCIFLKKTEGKMYVLLIDVTIRFTLECKLISTHFFLSIDCRDINAMSRLE